MVGRGEVGRAESETVSPSGSDGYLAHQAQDAVPVNPWSPESGRPPYHRSSIFRGDVDCEPKKQRHVLTGGDRRRGGEGRRDRMTAPERERSAMQAAWVRWAKYASPQERRQQTQAARDALKPVPLEKVPGQRRADAMPCDHCGAMPSALFYPVGFRPTPTRPDPPENLPRRCRGCAVSW